MLEVSVSSRLGYAEELFAIGYDRALFVSYGDDCVGAEESIRCVDEWDIEAQREIRGEKKARTKSGTYRR